MNHFGDQQQRFFITYIIAIVAVIVCLGAFLYRGYADDKAIATFLPLCKARSFVKLMVEYRKQRQEFPVDWMELKQATPALAKVQWKSIGKQQITLANYRYVITRLPEDRAALWAFPIGDYRTRGPAYCVILGASWARVWGRRALSDEAIFSLPVIPTAEVLQEARFQEVPTDKLQ